MVANPPAIRALAQRAGKVYAAADNFGDGYALGTSTDEGTTWQAFMTYADVKAINPCLKSACQTSCESQVSVSLWSEDVCSADAPGSTGTGGAAGSGGGGHAGGGAGGAGGAPGMGGTGATKTVTPKKGGCSVAATSPDAAPLFLLSAVWLAALLRRRRRAA
jgi:MYXO-CTERM domain-containing protein